VHPAFRLAAGRDSLYLPCFLVGPTRTVLPSFGAFTGGFLLTPQAHESIFLTTGDAIFKLGS
jgi:metallophosphoesterase superfamily enzyme